MKRYLILSALILSLNATGDATKSTSALAIRADGRYAQDIYETAERLLRAKKPEQYIEDIEVEDSQHNLEKYIENELYQNAGSYNDGEASKQNGDVVNTENGILRSDEARYREYYKTETKQYFDDPQKLDALLRNVPDFKAIDSNAIPRTAYVTSMISGGTWQPYSLAVAKNHAAFAKARGLNYHFVLFSQSAEGYDSRALLRWLDDKQPYWGKVFLLHRWLEQGFVREDNWVAWVDDDIVINDFGMEESHLDKVVASVSKSTCIVTARDFWKPIKMNLEVDSDKIGVPNTGIVLVKNSERCKWLVSKWLHYSEDPMLSKFTQAYTLHEQQALVDLVLDESNGSKKIKFVGNRTENWNLNTFKRFDHTYHARKSAYSTDIERKLAARQGDSYIHHTGMASLYRLALIAQTLWEIRDQYPVAIEGE